MLNPAMETALNDQIREELTSAYSYLAMSGYAEAANYRGIAHWLKAQASEELGHALRFCGYVYDRGGKVTLQAVAQPQAEYASVAEVFEQVLAHEQKISEGIYQLYSLAGHEKDYASYPFLQEFISEQVEEEKSAADVLALIRMAGGSTQALLMLDRELGRRGA